METAKRLLLVRRLAVIVVVMTFALMVLGSWVKATGSGLSCPDWPKCYGEWLPPFPSVENNGTYEGEPVYYSQAQILYEWSHRLVASILGVPFIALAVVAFRGKEFNGALRKLPLVAAGVLFLQVNLGGITVLGKNAAALTTMHLGMATVFFFLVSMIMAIALLRPFPDDRHIVEVRKEPGVVETVYPGEKQ
ncbi:MAG: COX15/CtaA family protein [Thermoplasmatota archaeon]